MGVLVLVGTRKIRSQQVLRTTACALAFGRSVRLDTYGPKAQAQYQGPLTVVIDATPLNIRLVDRFHKYVSAQTPECQWRSMRHWMTGV
jgi:hypothetical protein